MTEQVLDDYNAGGKLSVGSLLRGCSPGDLQTVGNMQVIPLITDLYVDDDFGPPDHITVSTVTYGSIRLTNTGTKPVIIPAHATYLTKQKAQDHAMAQAAIVPAGDARQFDDAMCVESGQGGTISSERVPLRILPHALREAAYAMRGQREYSKLWGHIQAYTTRTGASTRAHLSDYVQAYDEQLATFAAQFEIVPDQVGAIVLVGGVVAGIERAPNHRYWQAVWPALIRDCYGSLAMIKARFGKQNETHPVITTRVGLDVSGLGSLDELITNEAALEGVERALVSEQVRLWQSEAVEVQDRHNDHDGCQRITVASAMHMGQVYVRHGKPVYVSLVSTEAAERAGVWADAPHFDMG